jgi:hypothetical protein
VTRLVPPRYVCRTHNRDLTVDVLAKVDSDPMVTADMGWRSTWKGRAKVGTFEVDVRCPDGEGEGHLLRFEGSYEE